jgi:4-alpha-glucanotransferase
MVNSRSAGVILHPTCLPSRFGIGDLGPSAAAYVRWLAGAGVRWWQVLPLHPPGPGHSPYSAISTFAGNEMLISPDLLVADGLLADEDLDVAPHLPAEWVAFDEVIPFKLAMLRRAFSRFQRGVAPDLEKDLDAFQTLHGGWLRDYAVFRAARDAFGGTAWWNWSAGLARRDPETLDQWREEHQEEVGFVEFCQMIFFRQWAALHQLAAKLGVGIFGDIPIFVAGDSADVWSHPEIFKLDENLRPTVVAGVPPDYFSADGQLWGNPVYDWDRLAADDYGWWVSRVRHELEMVDLLRFDHFRGFAAYWEVDAAAETAVNGTWAEGPGEALFTAIREGIGSLPLVAEDLGEITPDVVELRKKLGLPGMAILHFGFQPQPRSSFIPYAHERDQVVYTGTHDNNTTVGWYLEDASDDEADLVRRYARTSGQEIHWDMIRLAMGSVAEMAVVPHQDLVGLGSDCRMNTPSVAEGNWRFRVTRSMLGEQLQRRLLELIHLFGRAEGHRTDGPVAPGDSEPGKEER